MKIAEDFHSCYPINFFVILGFSCFLFTILFNVLALKGLAIWLLSRKCLFWDKTKKNLLCLPICRIYIHASERFSQKKWRSVDRENAGIFSFLKYIYILN